MHRVSTDMTSMKKTVTFTPKDVKHIAKLANIPVTDGEEKKLATGFNSVMKVIDQCVPRR